MSEKLITVEQARNMLDRHITLWSGRGGIDWRNDITLEHIATPDDALHTIIHQAEQITRLQAAVVVWREVIEERYNNDLLADLVDDGIITTEDMEPTND